MNKLCNEEKLAVLPINIQDSNDFNENQKLILSKLYLLNGLNKTTKNDGWFFITNEELAEYADVSTTTVINITTKLKNVGFIERVSGKRNHASDYKLNLTIIDEYKDKRKGKGKKNTVRKTNLTDKNLTETLLNEINSLKLIINDLRNDIAELKGKGKKNDNIKNLTTDTESDKEKENNINNISIIPEYTSIYDNNKITENSEMICMSGQTDTTHQTMDRKNNDNINDDMNKTDVAIQQMQRQMQKKQNNTVQMEIRKNPAYDAERLKQVRIDKQYNAMYEYAVDREQFIEPNELVGRYFKRMENINDSLYKTWTKELISHWNTEHIKLMEKFKEVQWIFNDKQYNKMMILNDNYKKIYTSKEKHLSSNNEYKMPQPQHAEPENEFEVISATLNDEMIKSTTDVEKCAQNGLKCEIKASDVYAEFKENELKGKQTKIINDTEAEWYSERILSSISTKDEKIKALDDLYSHYTHSWWKEYPKDVVMKKYIERL